MSIGFNHTYSSIVGKDGPFEVNKEDGKYCFEFSNGLYPGFSLDETELRYSTKKKLSVTQQATVENFKEYIKEIRPTYFED